MPGNEQLGNQPPGPDPDLLSEAAAGYDPVAEAEAAMAGAAGQAEDGQSRLMGALKTAGSAIGEAARWSAPVVGTALKEETGVDMYRFSGEQPELDKDQEFAAGVARWAIRRGMEHLAERQASRA